MRFPGWAPSSSWHKVMNSELLIARIHTQYSAAGVIIHLPNKSAFSLLE